MRNVIICDDDRQIAEYLRGLIDLYCEQRGREARIQTVFEGRRLEELCRREKADILFLDIDLPGKSGVEIAERIRRRNQKIIIVFVTAYPEFALECARLHTYSYILKPFQQKEIYQVLDDIHKMYRTWKRADAITITVSRGEKKLAYRDILYVATGRNKVTFVTRQGEYETYLTVGRVLDELGEEFIRCHQSYIVNLSQIVMRSREFCEMSDGSRVPISRKYTAELKRAYAEWNMR